jgi:LAS superfamily LD-carboxypeptidase LdcB
MNALELTGRARTHVVELPDLQCVVHRDVAAALRALATAARDEAGIELAAISAFRDFERQRAIWNAKWRGERVLLDRAGRPLDAAALDADARIEAILAWSALPGASRHHWGTDIDVIDRAALPAGYRPQLVPQEYAPGGIFRRLDEWLTVSMGRFGFFRPYTRDTGGVQPEPWHLSHAATAQPACVALTVEIMVEAIAGADIEGAPRLIERMAEIRARFVAEAAA